VLASIVLPAKRVPTTKVHKSDRPKDEKPIRLKDLIVSKDVAGGRRTIFGSPPAAPSNRRKPQK